MRSLLFTTLFTFFSLFAFSASAQEESNIIQDIINAGGVVVANVSIENPTIVSQDGNKIDISFLFSNKGEQQSGVKYGIQLVKPQDSTGNQFVVDNHVFSEELILPTNSTLQKNITYKAPENLSGKYSLHILSKNKLGFPFSARIIGDVELEATKSGISIDLASCATGLKSDSESISEKVYFINCKAENTLDKDVSVEPSLTIKSGGDFGEKIKSNILEKENISFSAKEIKDFQVLFNGIEKPGVYAVEVYFSGSIADSNKVLVNAIIEGSVVNIANANLDKDHYKKGDVAKVKVLWSGNQNSVNAKISLKSRGLCAEEFSGPIAISNESPFTSIDFNITKKCSNPSIEVSFMDEDGNLLDKQVFSYKTISKEGPMNPLHALIWVVLIIFVVVLLAVAKKKFIDKENSK